MIVTVYLKYLCAPLLMSIFVSFWGSICFIRVSYISLSRVQHQLSARLVIPPPLFFFLLADFEAHFLDSSCAHGAPAMLQQPGSFEHGVAQSDIFLHTLPSFSPSRGVQRRVETVAALWECFEHYQDFTNGWDSVGLDQGARG